MSYPTRAVNALISIMRDDTAPVRRRIEATASLLDYETPAEIVEIAKEFLARTGEDTNQRVDDRLEALALLRRAEERKIRRPTAAGSLEVDRREEWRRWELFERQLKLTRSGIFPLPEGWDSDLRSPEYLAPPGLPPHTTSMGEAVRRGRILAEAREAAKRARSP